MNLQELYAKLNELKEASAKLEKAEDIENAIAEMKDIKAKIQLAEMEEADVKAEAEAKINGGKMKKVDGGEMNEDVRATALYEEGFYNFVRGAEMTPEQKQVVKEVKNTIGLAGVPVPKSFQNKLIIALDEMNIMRKLATVLPTASDLDIPMVATKGSAEWTDENASFNESDDTFSVVTFSAYKLTRIIKVSEEILSDVTFDLEGYLVQSFARALAKPEEKAFIVGTGTKQPKGVFVSAEVGVTAASATAIVADEIIDLYYSLPRAYRANATWILNDSTIKAIRKLKDGEGNYLWAQGLGTEPSTILGRPVETSEFAPTIATGKRVIAFGDMSYYNITDRGTRTFQRLNELYSAQGQVGFRGYERTDGKLTLTEAVKVLVMA